MVTADSIVMSNSSRITRHKGEKTVDYSVVNSKGLSVETMPRKGKNKSKKRQNDLSKAEQTKQPADLVEFQENSEENVKSEEIVTKLTLIRLSMELIRKRVKCLRVRILDMIPVLDDFEEEKDRINREKLKVLQEIENIKKLEELEVEEKQLEDLKALRDKKMAGRKTVEKKITEKSSKSRLSVALKGENDKSVKCCSKSELQDYCDLDMTKFVKTSKSSLLSEAACLADLSAGKVRSTAPSLQLVAMQKENSPEREEEEMWGSQLSESDSDAEDERAQRRRGKKSSKYLKSGILAKATKIKRRVLYPQSVLSFDLSEDVSYEKLDYKLLICGESIALI